MKSLLILRQRRVSCEEGRVWVAVVDRQAEREIVVGWFDLIWAKTRQDIVE